MSKLRLTFACGPYDRMDGLRSGEIAPEGIDLAFEAIQAPREIFDRMVQRQEFDLSELSASEFITMTGRGDCPFVALPVFPSKAFRHGFICINRNAGIRRPKDLEGKRIGTPMYTQTAAIWVRGHLEHEYGVDLDTVQWVMGAVEKPGSHGNPQPPDLLKPVNIEVNDTDKSLSDLLGDGAIDAVMGSRMPTNVGVHPDVIRLFPDYRLVEREFYRRTAIHPIMHLVAIRREIYDANPWIADSLYKAFDDAKNLALENMKFSGAQRYMLPFLYPDIDEIDELFGGDPWPYGVEANRPTLDAFIVHLVEQGFIAEPMPIEDLFVVQGG